MCTQDQGTRLSLPSASQGNQDPNDGDFEGIGFQSQQDVIIINHTSVGCENSQEMPTSKLWQTVCTRGKVREPLIGVDTCSEFVKMA